MYVCVCKAVTDKQIQHAIGHGAHSTRALHKCLGVGGVCGKCIPDVAELLKTQVNQQPLMQNSENASILAA